MRAPPNQMSERVTRVGSCPWQTGPLKVNPHTFSIPIGSSGGCQIRTSVASEISKGIVDYALSSSTSAFASFRSTVLNSSVNQL
jgi:hypothetical protein